MGKGGGGNFGFLVKYTPLPQVGYCTSFVDGKWKKSDYQDYPMMFLRCCFIDVTR